MAIRNRTRVLLFAVSGGLLLSVVGLANCKKQTVQPVAITADEMCSFCKMSISEKRYAAEFIDSEGEAFKFDDIGCMVNFLQQKRNQNEVRAYFVMDFDRREWIKAENAVYVRSSELDTPMSGGFIALRDQVAAQDAASKYHGKLLSFDEVLKSQ